MLVQYFTLICTLIFVQRTSIYEYIKNEHQYNVSLFLPYTVYSEIFLNHFNQPSPPLYVAVKSGMVPITITKHRIKGTVYIKFPAYD